MEIFRTKWFARFARQERINDDTLLEAIRRAEHGLIDADLGGGLIKLRVGRPGQGRSGGYRMIVAFRAKSRAFFVFAFAKSDRENIEPNELLVLRQVAATWLDASEKRIATGLEQDEIQEIPNEEET